MASTTRRTRSRKAADVMADQVEAIENERTEQVAEDVTQDAEMVEMAELVSKTAEVEEAKQVAAKAAEEATAQAVEAERLRVKALVDFIKAGAQKASEATGPTCKDTPRWARGWDEIHMAWDDSQIEAAIAGAKTERGALAKMAKHTEAAWIRRQVAEDIQSA